MSPAPRIAYFGASGSFGEEAAHAYAERSGGAAGFLGADELGSATPEAVLEALERGRCELALLPVANSSAGLVWPTLQALAGRRFELVDEVELPVRLALLVARPGIAPARIARVASHPLALRLCARNLARLLPARPALPWSDTASAARALATGALDARTAVVASPRAGELHGLTLLAREVHDQPDNRTFFAVFRHVCGTALQ